MMRCGGLSKVTFLPRSSDSVRHDADGWRSRVVQPNRTKLIVNKPNDLLIDVREYTCRCFKKQVCFIAFWDCLTYILNNVWINS